MQAKKLTFQEAWDSSCVFYVDDSLEDEIDAKVTNLIALSSQLNIVANTSNISKDNLVDFLQQNVNGLDVILRDIGLSDEKFMRIISLLRRLGRFKGTFEAEWSISKIKRRIFADRMFTQQIIDLVLDGKRDPTLAKYIPRYYLDMLNFREIGSMPQAARAIRYKSSQIGTYGAKKGYRVEAKIASALERIERNFEISYEKGRSRFVDVDVDFAIPSLTDPQIILMSSFQETTGSGQSTKARDMESAFERLNRSNSRYGENRIFINFVDGGGWLARKRDFQRLVERCHYFINLAHLAMLSDIILSHTKS